MYSHQGANTFDRQIVTLQNLLPQLDAEWEMLTRSIQADQQRLTALQEWRQEFSLLLSAEPEPAAQPALALTGHLEMLEQRMRQVVEEIVRKQLLRRALEQRFDEVRLVLCALQQQGV